MTNDQRMQSMTEEESLKVLKQLSDMMAQQEMESIGKRIAYAKKFKKEQREREQKQQ